MRFFVFIIIFLSSSISVLAQDTIVANDGTVLNGEIKEMDKGSVVMETSFSDDDFTIKWLEVKQFTSPRSFRFTLQDGSRLYGTISKDSAEDKLIIIDEKKGTIKIESSELVYLKQVDGGSFFDVLNLSMDFGYSLSKANNLKTINGSLFADYIVNKWGVKGFYKVVNGDQDDAERTDRQEREITGEAFFARDFYTKVTANLFNNNAQDIKLRSSYSLSIGKYFVHTNRIYFNSDIGIAYTLEDYLPDTVTDRKNVEGKLGLEYSMFDVGDLNLFAKVNIFPSIGEPGRVRSLLNLTMKYDLPRDFYIKASADYQYDNKPIEGADPDDYVFTFGFGWEL